MTRRALMFLLASALAAGETPSSAPPDAAPRKVTLQSVAGQMAAHQEELMSRKIDNAALFADAVFNFARGECADPKNARDWHIEFGNGGDVLALNRADDGRSRIEDLGRKTWPEPRELPPLARHQSRQDAARERVQVQPGRMYLIHVKDSASDLYAVFRVEALAPGKECTFTWKPVPAPAPRKAPSGLAVAREKDDTVLTWKPVEGASGYRIWSAGQETPVDVAEPRHLLSPGAFHQVRVSALYPDGDWSEAEAIEAAAYPPAWKKGTFQLNAFQEGYSFSEGKTVPRGEAELFVADSAGGFHDLTFSGSHGLALYEGRCVLEVPADDLGRAFAQKYLAEACHPPSDCFLVRSAEGGLACVRLRERRFPSLAFEYLYRPPQVPAAADAPRPLDPKEAEAVRKMIARLDHDAMEEREKAFGELQAFGKRAMPEVEKALQKTPTPEVQARLEQWKSRVLRKEPPGDLKKQIDGGAPARNRHGKNGRDPGWEGQ